MRAIDGALVYEIGRRPVRAAARAHREWVDQLAEVMEARLQARDSFVAAYEAHPRRQEIAARVRRHFFGEGGGPRSAVPAD